MRKAPFLEKVVGRELQHTALSVCMREAAILFFALDIYQSQAQARQRTVRVCVCVYVGGSGRGQLIPLILINSLKLSNTCHGVCTGLLLEDKQVQHKTPDLMEFMVSIRIFLSIIEN